MNIRKPTAEQAKLIDAHSGSQVRFGVREYLKDVINTMRREQLEASAQALPQSQGMAGACIALEQLQAILSKISERKPVVMRFPQTSVGLAGNAGPWAPKD